MLLNDERAFRQSLDEQSAKQQRLQVEALDRALAKHDAIRTSAERARERIELELQQERIRRDADEKRALEEARRKLEEQKLAEQRRQLEEQQAREEDRKRQDTLKRDQEEARKRSEAQRQQEEEEKAKKTRDEKEEADRKARQQAEEKERQQKAEEERKKAAQQPAPPATPPSIGFQSVPQSQSQSQPPSTSAPPSTTQLPANLPTGIVSSTEERDATHRKYLDLHKRLKQMRHGVSEEAKKYAGLKNQLSDWRRDINTRVGQISRAGTQGAKDTNRQAVSVQKRVYHSLVFSDRFLQMRKIVEQLDAAAKVAEPSIDITEFLVQDQQPPGAPTKGPAALLFLLNHFAKRIVAAFCQESSAEPDSADPIGVVAVTIFARPQYLFNGQSLIDVLWAKYHHECPVLFGISGSEKTTQGKIRIGWRMEKLDGEEDKPNPKRAFVNEQTHFERMSGLAAGFSAITLRDFSKSQNANPAPNRIFWESMARILNTPAPEVQSSHFVVLKAMITTFVPRIISTFGGAGLALLRQALIAFPRDKGIKSEKGQPLSSVMAVQALPMTLQKTYNLSL